MSVREKIERGEKYYALLNDKSKWNQYCASLYAIEDAQCAIEAYTSYEIEDIDEIFKLLNEPKGMLRERIDYYLTEILFIKLGNLEKYAEEIDEEFRNE